MKHTDRRAHRRKKKESWNVVSGMLRMGFVGVMAALQILSIFLLTYYAQIYSSIIYYTLVMLAIIMVLYVISKPNSSAYKIAWIVLMLAFPVAGMVMYVAWGNIDFDKRERGFLHKSFQHARPSLTQDPQTWQRFAASYPQYMRHVRNLQSCQPYPIYQHSQSQYYPLGDHWWPALLADLENAQRFIFMEFFIVEDGELWQSVLDILVRKAAQGVEVRFMFDDMGSVMSFSHGDIEQIRGAGIDVQVFNPVNRYISALYINYRNHQKIVVIDGNVSYVGGTNLADEYANLYPKHGHWKDTCLRLEGQATWSLTVIFLQMWDLNRKQLTLNYDDYRPSAPAQDHDGAGYYLPMEDGPGHKPSNPAINMYKLMVSNSQTFCYITSPYLILDDEFLDVLCIAGRAGVDVRIVVPHIPDHWYVHLVTQSFYAELIAAGVRIYEYTPGYIHAKMMVSDDKVGVLGSINMDFRSFFLHYEDAVWMCETPVLADMKADIEEVMSVSQEIQLADCKAFPWYKKAGQLILRVFAPMF